ncbi:putative DNA repair protein Dds20/Mei5 [Aspergillus homomorphus CBS 101889]|uniref:Swi5-dependent recombination DNA repair protein 1 n=1 Tax=Aspergillus homomorphus (strain CBS 101889) TaxID=1450537 RepID=A0A395IER6_ASPHC|nr:hypothetical protein BO97DRAFT_439644 [Aspergillus homomorphus CBS 101889]RAL16664.1 hypothetical protein BO97DRAFT_439644 [Aspergillus homomorphus CBS 101889]
MNTHKRRRLNPASTLSKPFKSPLRRPVPATGAEKGGTSDTDLAADRSGVSLAGASIGGSGSTAAQGDGEGGGAPEPATPTRTRIQTSPPHPQKHHQPRTPQPSTSTSTSTSTGNTSNTPTCTGTRTPKLNPLRTPRLTPNLNPEIKTLQTNLKALKSEHDTLHQALRIEQQNKTLELEQLIQKWRAVSQRAAEEVFLGAAERVGRMGGLDALRQGSRGRSWGWEVDSSGGSCFEEEGIRDEDGGKDGKAEVEDQEFTMGVMLKMLNIDLKVIGYDVSREGWV